MDRQNGLERLRTLVTRLVIVVPGRLPAVVKGTPHAMLSNIFCPFSTRATLACYFGHTSILISDHSPS